ncbi:MAG: endonuclease domain-containing protein [Chitinophagaceae bacterium]
MTDSYRNNLHKGAIGKLFEYSRDLRQVSTEAEKMLWTELRNRKLNGLKFRRQHPIDKYIADFYCHETKLVIELDGEIHDVKENNDYDKARTVELKEQQITVIRFRNDEIVNSMQTVLQEILEVLNMLGKE